MKLKRFLLRYYPPGIILEYELRDKTREMKEVRLLLAIACRCGSRFRCCFADRPAPPNDGDRRRGADQPDRVRGATYL